MPGPFLSLSEYQKDKKPWDRGWLESEKHIIKMSAPILSKNRENSFSDNIIKMNNHTIKELSNIAKERGLSGYYKFKKADLFYFLKENERPIRSPRSARCGRAVHQVQLIPHPKDTENFVRHEMQKVRPCSEKQ